MAAETVSVQGVLQQRKEQSTAIIEARRRILPEELQHSFKKASLLQLVVSQ